MRKHPSPARFVTAAIALCGLLPLASVHAIAEDSEEKDHVAVLEFGATGEREISERTSHLGPTVGIEIEPMENWLEVELGASTYRSQGATNWEFELPFKKPFRLSSTIEVMPGLGPTWAHTTQPGVRSSVWGAEAVIDFFFWRSKRLGWYLEPSYGVALGNGDKKSVALTAGIFFAVP
ncbi:MAG: hypothetical protein ACLPTF_12655 [Steroidobacteraceae bacterium]